jgi:hypothetical protein
LKSGDLIKIDAGGLIGTPRSDGCTFFGITRDPNSKVFNDVLYQEEVQTRKTDNHRFFVINFDEDYLLQDLGFGRGTFVKIEDPVLLNTGDIVSFSNSHLGVNITEPETIQLTFLENNGKSFSFHSSQKEI